MNHFSHLFNSPKLDDIDTKIKDIDREIIERQDRIETLLSRMEVLLTAVLEKTTLQAPQSEEVKQERPTFEQIYQKHTEKKREWNKHKTRGMQRPRLKDMLREARKHGYEIHDTKLANPTQYLMYNGIMTHEDYAVWRESRESKIKS